LGNLKRWQDQHPLRERNLRCEKRMTSIKRSQYRWLRSVSIQRTNKFRRAPTLFPSGGADLIFPVTRTQIGWKPSVSSFPRFPRADLNAINALTRSRARPL